jgi:hypothetical protein
MLANLRSPVHNDALAIAYDCLASLAMHSKGARGAVQRAVDDAEKLRELQSLDSRGRAGWSYLKGETEKSRKCQKPGAIDAFGDGTCNPPETPYMIQTGYAVACLAQLHLATGQAKYLNLAKSTISDSWELGTAPLGCHECFYFWYSYHSNDLNRYVRNTNLIMGLGVAWLYAATGDVAYRNRALAIARAEHREINARNFGYFGIDDSRYQSNPKLESQRIENHIVHQVKALKDIGTLLGHSQAIDDSKVMLDAFLECRNERCRLQNCKAWAAPASCKATATIAPCILTDQDGQYQSRCKDVLKELPRLNAFQLFLLDSTSEAERLRLK